MFAANPTVFALVHDLTKRKVGESTHRDRAPRQWPLHARLRGYADSEQGNSLRRRKRRKCTTAARTRVCAQECSNRLKRTRCVS